MRRLFSSVRVYRRTTDLSSFSFYSRTSVNRISVCVKETSCKIVTYIQCRWFSEENNFSVGRNTFSTFKNLKGNKVSFHFYHLSQTAVYSGKFII